MKYFKVVSAGIKCWTFAIFMLLILTSCEKRSISRWYVYNDKNHDRFFKIISFDSDSTFNYKTFGYGILYDYSSGSYHREGSSIVLESKHLAIDDSILVESSLVRSQGYILINFSYLRSEINQSKSLMVKFNNSLIDTTFCSLFSPLVLFDNYTDVNFLKDNLVGCNAFWIGNTRQKATITLINGNKMFPISIDTIANVYNIKMYSEQYDSLTNYRFFNNEKWKLKGNRLFDPRAGIFFTKRDSLSYYLRNLMNMDIKAPTVLITNGINQLDSLGRRQGIWKTVPDSLPNFGYNLFNLYDQGQHVDKHRMVSNNDSLWGLITLYETYIDGKRNGIFKGLRNNINLDFFGEYKNDKLEGKFYSLDVYGNVSYFLNFRRGILHGKSIYNTMYNKREVLYENGILRELILFDTISLKRNGGEINMPYSKPIEYVSMVIKCDRKGRPYNGRVYGFDYRGKVNKVVIFRNHKIVKLYDVFFNWKLNKYEFINEDLEYPWWWKH